MEWSKRMNAALDYIEDNLVGEIDFGEAARKACCSLFHFHNPFPVSLFRKACPELTERRD